MSCRYLSAGPNVRPVAVIRLAQEARIPEALRAAFYELHRLYDGRGHTRICRVNDLTTGDLHRLVMGRERLRMVVTAILTDDSLYEDELYAMHFATVDFNGSKEICRKHVEDWWDKKAERLAFDDLALLNDPYVLRMRRGSVGVYTIQPEGAVGFSGQIFRFDSSYVESL